MSLSTILTVRQIRYLAKVFELGAASASDALSRWIGKPVRLVVGRVEEVGLAEASEVLGPGDELVAACIMEMTSGLPGQIILAFQDRSGLGLVDVLLGQPLGTTTTWGEIEQSAAKETTNIIGCAYLNALAAHLPALSKTGGSEPLIPGPPYFRHEFAASLLEFALMDQAVLGDRLLVIKSSFSMESSQLDWSLLFVPSGQSLETLHAVLSPLETPLS
jgi:chemotaxis protein CheC